MTTPIQLLAATRWSELHEAPAAAGMRYERKGSGARIVGVADADHDDISGRRGPDETDPGD